MDDLVEQLANELLQKGEEESDESEETEVADDEDEEGDETEEEGDETEDQEGDETDASDLVDGLADKLVGRVLQASLPDDTDLDDSTLGKPDYQDLLQAGAPEHTSWEADQQGLTG